MWQSCVEIEGYSIAYFNHIAAFKALYCWTSFKGVAHTRFVDSLDVYAFMNRVWKFSNTALRMRRCDQNTRWNNLRFLHGTYRHTCFARPFPMLVLQATNAENLGCNAWVQDLPSLAVWRFTPAVPAT